MNTESKHSDSQQHGAGEAAEQSPPQEDLQKVHADLEARFVKLSSELSKTVDLVAPAYRESLALMMNPPRSQEAPAIYQIGLMTKDGRRVPVRISPRLICWEENPIGVLAVGHEIAWSEHGKEPQRTPSADLVIRLEQETAELTRANGQLHDTHPIH